MGSFRQTMAEACAATAVGRTCRIAFLKAITSVDSLDHESGWPAPQRGRIAASMASQPLWETHLSAGASHLPRSCPPPHPRPAAGRGTMRGMEGWVVGCMGASPRRQRGGSVSCRLAESTGCGARGVRVAVLGGCCGGFGRLKRGRCTHHRLKADPIGSCARPTGGVCVRKRTRCPVLGQPASFPFPHSSGSRPLSPHSSGSRPLSPHSSGSRAPSPHSSGSRPPSPRGR